MLSAVLTYGRHSCLREKKSYAIFVSVVFQLDTSIYFTVGKDEEEQEGERERGGRKETQRRKILTNV